jgi:phage tail tape-measure protein
MSDFQSQVQVDMTGNLAAEAKRGERAIQGLSTRSTRAFNRMRKASMGLSNAINGLGNRYTGLVTGGGLALAARGVVDFDARLKDIEVQAGMTGKQINTLKSQLFETAQNTDIRIDPSQLLSAVEAIVDKTGDLDLAQSNLENMGLAIRAAGAQGAHIGSVVAALKKLDITAPNDVRHALELLIEQGKEGSFRFHELAGELAPLAASLATMGQKGMGAVRTLGALAQTTQSATENAAESSTAIQGLINEISAKAQSLEKKGITVYDPEALKEGNKQLLGLDQIVRSIMERSKGDMALWGTLFGDEAKKALKTLGADYIESGTLTSLDRFLAIQADGSKIVADAAAKTHTMRAAIDSLNGSLAKVADENLSAPIQAIADALHDLGSENLNKLFSAAATGATVAGGIWAVNKAIRTTAAGVRMVGALRGRSNAGGIAAKAIGQMAAQPVMVTNWPIGFGNTVGGADTVRRNNKSRGRQAGLSTGLGKVARRIGRRAIPGAALAMGAYSMGSAALSGDTQGIMTGGGALAGGLAGAQAGALTGALLGPIGSAIGTVLGGGLGAWLGEEMVSSFFTDKKAEPSQQDNQFHESANKISSSLDKLENRLSNLSNVVTNNTNAQTNNSRARRHPDMGGLEAG